MTDSAFRFSLRWLLIGVAICAVGITALLHSNQTWRTVVISFSALAWMIAVLCAIFLTGSWRAFAIGFAIWGFAYMALSLILWEKESRDHNRLLTTELLELLWTSMLKAHINSRPGVPLTMDLTAFLEIGQLLWAWLLATCGGFLAKFLYLRSQRSAGNSLTPGDSLTPSGPP